MFEDLRGRGWWLGHGAESEASLNAVISKLQGGEQELGDEVARLRSLERALAGQVSDLGVRETTLKTQVDKTPLTPHLPPQVVPPLTSPLCSNAVHLRLDASNSSSSPPG